MPQLHSVLTQQQSPRDRAATAWARRVVLLAGFLGGPSKVGIQEPIVLRPASSKLDEEFSRIVGVRELSDGRLLVADGRDQRLVIADFRRNRVAAIGRAGKGPGEYTQVTALHALGPDSTFMVDYSNGRWVVLAGTNAITTKPADHPGVRAVGRVALASTDGRGHAVGTTPPAFREGKLSFGKGDSVAILLINLETGVSDTVGLAQTAPVSVWTQLDAAGKVTRAGQAIPPFAVGEEPLLFPDGWIAVMRLDPYRVDWRTPAGVWVRGEPVAFDAVPVDDREREVYSARAGLAMAGPNPAWPPVVPAFEKLPGLAAPDGSLLVRRTPSARHPAARYDRIDRKGRFTGWLELAAGQQLVGFGARAAYVVTTNEDGIQHLQKHPWP